MKVLVFGRSGQVATELARCVPEAIFLGRDRADFMDPDRCVSALTDARPDVVINAVAYTAVDKAESDEAAAHRVNATTPGALAAAAARMDVPFVHISTDFVFDGQGTDPFHPGDPTGPLGAYGRTKLEGERAVAAAGGRHAILRTSWVFSAHGANFVRTMLRLSETRDALTVVGDQIGGPTPAGAIAEACLTIATALKSDGALAGTYHFSGQPDVSWADFAREIFRQAGRAVTVRDIPASDYPRAAKVPANSRLDCSATRAAFGIERPDWREALTGVLKSLGARDG